jgi:hypothetical protein
MLNEKDKQYLTNIAGHILKLYNSN